MTKGTSAEFGDFVMAGCGNTSYIYMTFEDIQKALDSPTNIGRDVVEVIREKIRAIREHINACHHPGQEVPYLEMVIGIHKEPAAPVLLHIEDTGAIARIYDKVLMGSGRPVAVAFARIILNEQLPLAMAKLAAFFFIYQAKQSGYGCGGQTQVCYLPRPKPEQMEVWDDEGMAEQVEETMRLCLLDARNTAMTKEQFSERLKGAFQKILAIRNATVQNDAFHKAMPEVLASLKSGEDKPEAKSPASEKPEPE